MSQERWRRTKALFQEALLLDGAEREDLLDRACGDDPERRVEIESLLASHGESGSFLERPPSRIAAEVLAGSTGLEAVRDGELADRERPTLEGRRLGPYKILHRIGRGGLGSVYLAAREEGFEKQVAIKVIRRTVATPDLLRRFESERQILASIEHPNIARLMDGGTTEEGLPYLVMEYIDGEPIDRFCDRERLTIRQRLTLFTTVCRAVGVAHQNLVVHCDIKPDNVLVTADGTPKLLDFGIAKILSSEPAPDGTGATDTGMRILTPDYASPEQLLGRTITTASDVYSLGVLLHELVGGARPDSFGDLSLDEVARRVSESKPQRPSGRSDTARLGQLAAFAVDGSVLETVAARRSTTPRDLKQQLTGDLAHIVLKALQPDAGGRYSAVERFAADVEFLLGGFPVLARRASVSYRATKFVRRHRLAVTAAAVGFATVLAFLGVLAVQSARLAAARDRAEKEAGSAKVVSEFLQGMLTSADPFEGIGGTATVIESLDASVSGIQGAFAGEPELEAAVRNTAGMTYLQLGRYSEAESQLLKSLEIRRRLGGEHQMDLARSLNSVGRLNQDRGAYAEAEAHYREALAIEQRAVRPDRALTAETVGHLATVLHDRGDFAGAEILYRESLEMRRTLFGPEHEQVASGLDDLANLVQERGESAVAEKMYREALAIRRRLLAAEHPDISASLNNVAAALHDQENLDGAEKLYRESLGMARRRFGDEHPEVATGINNLATLLHDQNKLTEAETLYRESLAMSRRLLGQEHPQVATGLSNLAALLHDNGELAEAETLYRESLAMSRKFLGDAHPDIATGLDDLSIVLEDRGDLAGAEAALRSALEVSRKAGGEEHENFGFTLAALASVICRRGDVVHAGVGFQESIALLERIDADEERVAEIRSDFDACRSSDSN